MVSRSCAPHLWQARPVWWRCSAVRSVTSNTLTYSLLGVQAVQTCGGEGSVSRSRRPAQAPEAQRDRSLQCTCSHGARRWPCEADHSARGARRSSETPHAAPGGETRARQQGGCAVCSAGIPSLTLPRAPRPGATPTLHEASKAKERSRPQHNLGGPWVGRAPGCPQQL